jgi:redox-sensitive bicupin YhaK (pirin superfamily)
MAKWKSRIVGHAKVKAATLMANPFNHRVHPMRQKEMISASIREIGFVKSVTVNKSTGHIIDGHERVQQALATKSDVDVEYVELSEEEERKALLMLDAMSELAEVDHGSLERLFEEIGDFNNHALYEDMLTAFAFEEVEESEEEETPAPAFVPNLAPVESATSTTGDSVQSAQEAIQERFGALQTHAPTRKVACPHCGKSFDISGA